MQVAVGGEVVDERDRRPQIEMRNGKIANASGVAVRLFTLGVRAKAIFYRAIACRRAPRRRVDRQEHEVEAVEP